ncbi:MAG: T9SS type A sorting domain-containing protein [Ignavibacteriales bacterium]|nr:MAG: T9SS type A sorting domain-containing protein [Ignavibacteriales bacterium]
MKHLFFLCLLTLRIFPQVEQTASVELYFGTESTFGGPITFYLSNQGQVWGGDLLATPCIMEYYLSNDFNDPSYTITNHNQPVNQWEGMDFTTSISWFGADVYGYGLYRVTNSESTAHFYIDYRDQRISCYPGTTTGHTIDVWIKYNGSTSSFSYSNNGESLPFYSIINDQYLTMWELKNVGSPHIDQLPDFWDHGLALIPSQSGNHPRLVWGPHPTLTDVVAYKVYRKYGTSTFDPIATNDFDKYDYIDTELTLDLQQGGANAYYFVKAVVINESESEATNTVVANIAGQSPEKQINLQNTIYNFQINNYPNPFNPTTNIQYSIPTDGLVSLIVYDLLGREVATLVSESKTAGSYSVDFNASTFASGTYIYQLKAGEFLSTKKMLLIK